MWKKNRKKKLEIFGKNKTNQKKFFKVQEIIRKNGQKFEKNEKRVEKK